MRLSSLLARALGRPDPARLGGPPAQAPARVLFLDDDPLRAEVFLADCPHAVWVQTAADCIEKLAEPWDEVHLDHDLGGEQFVDHSRDDCGMEVVRWISLEPRTHLHNSRFTVHSHNPGAATLMAMQLMSNGFRVDVRPFGAPPATSVIDPQLPAPPLTLGGVVWAIRSLFRKPANEVYGYDEYMRDSNNAPPERLDLSWKLTPRDPEPEPGAGAGRRDPPVVG